MTDKTLPSEPKPAADAGSALPGAGPATPPGTPGAGTAVVPPRRGPGHRGADVRDTVAEMAAKAQEISQEAGSKIAAAMKDVINAAAGLAGFAVESARDLVQYMVRRGQMTQEEADKLLREAEDAHVRRGGSRLPPAPRLESSEPRRMMATPVSNSSVMPASVPSPSTPAKKAAAPPQGAPEHRVVTTKAAKPAARQRARPAKSAKPARSAKAPSKSSRPVAKKASPKTAKKKKR